MLRTEQRDEIIGDLLVSVAYQMLNAFLVLNHACADGTSHVIAAATIACITLDAGAFV
jgi:hypothetical protein